MNFTWVFNGGNNAFPSGVFSSREKAEQWISEQKLSGCLTKYPVDEGAYQWAVREGLFTPKHDDQTTPKFIGGFACGHIHFHYEDGKCLG